MEQLSIELFDDIGGWNGDFDAIRRQTRGFSGSKIIVPIHSYGGSVVEGFAIYNHLKGFKNKDVEVVAEIQGSAMSMATVVAMAASKVTMPDQGYFMIHNPWTLAIGDHKEMSTTSATLEAMTKDIARAYKEKVGDRLSIEEIIGLMEDETWMNPQKALELGFIDEITSGVTYYAKYDKEILNKLKNVPKNLVDMENTLLNKVAKFLGLSNNASEADVIQALEKSEGLQAKIDANKELIQAINIEGITAKITEVEDKLNTLTELEGKLSTQSETIENQAKLIDAQAETITELTNRSTDLAEKNTELAKVVATMAGKTIQGHVPESAPNVPNPRYKGGTVKMRVTETKS